MLKKILFAIISGFSVVFLVFILMDILYWLFI
jgi:hypothetical protein